MSFKSLILSKLAFDSFVFVRTPQHMIPMNQNHSMHSNINVGPMNNMPVNPQNYQPIRINQRQNNQRNFNARPNHQYAPVPVNFDGPFIHSYVPYSPLNIMQNPYYAIGPQICQIPSQNPIRLPNPPSTSIANEVIPSAVLENQKIMPPPIQQASPHQSSHSQVGRKKKTAILQDPDSLEEKDLVEYAKLPFSSSSTSSNNNQANKIDKNEEVKQNTASSNDKKIMEFLQLSCLAQSPAKTNETNLDKKQNEEQVKQTEVKNKEIKNEKVHEAVSVNNPKETTEKSLSSGNKVATQTSKVVQPATTESTSNVSKKSQQDQILVKKDDIDQKTVPVLVNEPVKVETEEMETVRAIETKLDNLKISNPPETKVNKDDKIDSLVKTKPELKVSEKSSTSQNKTEDQKQSSVEKLNEVQDQKKQSSDASNLQKTKSTSDLLIYDVDFLKNLQFTEISTQKPNFGNLGHRLEIVLDKARRDNESFDYSNDFQPKFGKPSSIGETYEKSIFESKQDLKRNFDKQMNALEDVVKQNQVTSRIKFLIMDVLDMRREGWKIRKLQDTFKPKTLDEVHEDIKRQDEISNREINQISKRNDSMKRKDWMNPQRKSQQKESLINIRKLNDLNKQQQTNFAPTGFFASWSSGALGAKPVESDNSKPASLVSKNFSFRYQSEDKYKNNSLKQRNSSNVEKNVEVVSTFGGNYHGGDEQKDMNFIAAYEENIVEIAKKWVNAGLSFEDFVNNETEASVNEILESNVELIFSSS
ncbi:hypothetical protein RND71_043694 [Anisodus tanguticus]|uniref:Uncharacterized protein n=1 Tax=Anisodus tanguticus TaxID=243964 RepID=A0AAE1QNG6_9SOLA|nr:hypothetical protein RND71_043694 [Anisodus tanguticus]